jgi:L-asparaginase / beta-aspartyl-peptidase
MRATGATVALVVHGGAGMAGPARERPARRRGMMEAVRRGAAILRAGGSALDAVVASVVALEDDPLFNAGYGSVLNTEGSIEMDAGVMAAWPAAGRRGAFETGAGAVAAVRRVKNPVVLARAVMEHTGHVLMAGAGAEGFARKIGIPLCRNADLISERALGQWRAGRARGGDRIRAERPHGTVGAAAIDAEGRMAAAVSTGGVTGKMPGRVGDCAVIGAGVFAERFGAASATGDGEAIITAALCRAAVGALERAGAPRAADRVIARLIAPRRAGAGIIMVDRAGRIGYAHNAQSMQVGIFDSAGRFRHVWAAPIAPRTRRR